MMRQLRGVLGCGKLLNKRRELRKERFASCRGRRKRTCQAIRGKARSFHKNSEAGRFVV
jgi:hypothetical protein